MDNVFGDRFLGVREAAWHKLGTVIDEPMPIVEAAQLAGLDFNVVKIPMMISWPPDETDPEKITIFDSGKVALTREPTADDPEPRVFGVASDQFEIVQNMDMARLLEPLNERWPIETMGSLKYGAVTFMTLMTGEFDVAGEQVNKHLLISNGHDGTRGFNIKDVRTRVVCDNTLQAAEGESSLLDFSLRHVTGVQVEASWHLDLIGKLEKQSVETDELMQKMGETELEDQVLESMIDAAFPLPRKPRKLVIADAAGSEAVTKEQIKAALELRDSTANKNSEFERATERITAIRAGTMDQYDRICDNYPNIANTVWGGLNAITEVSNWREGRAPEASVMFGERREEGRRAYAVAVDAVRN